MFKKLLYLGPCHGNPEFRKARICCGRDGVILVRAISENTPWFQGKILSIEGESPMPVVDKLNSVEGIVFTPQIIILTSQLPAYCHDAQRGAFRWIQFKKEYFGIPDELPSLVLVQADI